jgi:spermidine/putrescine transport system permease protein
MSTVPVLTEPAPETPRNEQRRGPWRPDARWLRNPWGKPRFLVGITWVYIAWALLPVLLAILFSFNAGRSRSVWQGFSIRWWWGDPAQSIFHDPDYMNALRQSLTLAFLDMLVATPLGVLLALGLARWRGRGAGTSNTLMLVPLVTPELVMATSLLLVFTQVAIIPFSLIRLGTTAQVVGQVTFSLSYVVVIVRSRLVSISGQYEEAARDLGATRWGALRLVLVPLLFPAILASMLIVFALSLDDFVVTQYMSGGYSTTTIPMYLYANARGGVTTPALNALATILVVVTLLGIGCAYLVYTRLGRRVTGRKLSALRALSGVETAGGEAGVEALGADVG